MHIGTCPHHAPVPTMHHDTVNGTGVRDYIHVVDLAKGHVKAIEKLINGVSDKDKSDQDLSDKGQSDKALSNDNVLGEGVKIYNLGTGKGTTVLELVNAFIKVNKIDVPYKIVGRRPGDIATCFADASKAEKELGWKAELTIDDMVRDAWRFERMNETTQ